jgi:hypothetical protein
MRGTEKGNRSALADTSYETGGMVKKTGWILFAAVIVAGTLQAQTFNKYSIKSAIVTLESVSKVSTMEIKMTKVVYFDDYGIKECEETYKDGKLSSVLFSDGKDKISLDLQRKTAHKQDSGRRGTGTRIDINDMGTEKDIQSGVVKKMPPMTLAGQTCEVIYVTRGRQTDIYAGWNKFMVYLKTGGSTVVSEIKAVKIEPNAIAPKEKFQIPAGFKLQ